MNYILLYLAFLITLFTFSADLDFGYEITHDVSDEFNLHYDIVEIKNHLQQYFLIRFIDDRRGLMAPEEIKKQFVRTNIEQRYDYELPSAQEKLQECGYLRMKMPHGCIAKEFSIILYLATTDEEGNIVPTKNLLTGERLGPVAQFRIQADPQRRLCLISLDQANGKIILRVQKGRSGGMKKAVSRFPKERNVKSRDIGKNIVR